MLDEERLIELLNQTATLLEFFDENKFKINAYLKAAEIIESYNGKFFELYNSGQYKNIPGIGKGMQEFIKEFDETNTNKVYEELLSKAPKDFFEMLKIRGLGVKRIKIIYNTFNINTISELENACLENKLTQIKGITEKFCKDVISEIERIKRDKNKLLLSKAEKIAEQFEEEFLNKFNNYKIIRTGELRRISEVISNLEFIVVTDDIKLFYSELRNYFDVYKNEELDSYYKIELNFNNKFPITIYVVLDEYNLIKQNFLLTGSNEFLTNLDLSKITNYHSEKEIFKQLNLTYLIPTQREIENLLYLDKLSFNNTLSLNDINSLMHFHTTWSDGIASIEEMCENAIKNKLSYFIVSDHSKTAIYANGLTENRVIAQAEEIEVLRKDKSLNIFHGIESDILPDGNLDYDNDYLSMFNFVIASIHSKFDLSKEEMTNRIIKAIENPNTDVIGHVSGRILLRRKPYEIDIEKILDACAINNVAIEINSSPSRLDLDRKYIYYARDKGVKFCINPDAHSIGEIGVLKYGVKIAEKAGVTKQEVINCMEIDEFINYINRKVKRNVRWSKNGLERIN